MRLLRQGINRQPFWIVSLSTPSPTARPTRSSRSPAIDATTRRGRRVQASRRTRSAERATEDAVASDARARPPAHRLRAPGRVLGGDARARRRGGRRSRSTRASRCPTGASSTPCWRWAGRWAPATTPTIPGWRRSSELVREAVEDGRPFLGVCLGVQLLAAALGARVYPAERPEVGLLEVELTAGGPRRPAVRRPRRPVRLPAVARRHLRPARRMRCAWRARR